MYHIRNTFRRSGYSLTIVMIVWLTSLSPVRLNSIPGAALAASDPVIAAAGDIACHPSDTRFKDGKGTATACRQKYTSDLLVNAGLEAVLALGDNQYRCGDYQAYMQSYDLSWGRLKSITRPVPGNHEYTDMGGEGCSTKAAGYFKYFGSAAGSSTKGYYSYNIGTWHLVALNSNCSAVGGCGSTSPQGKWLAADLAANRTFCTLAYWHSPLFNSGELESTSTRPFWKILYKYGADVILNGHSHIYERFAPQTPNGEADPPYGIREFIVGTGGESHTSTTETAANSQVRNTNTYGVLKLTLHPTSYDWQFVPEAGKTFSDSGTRNCHKPPPNLPTSTVVPDIDR